jgi:RNA polymerase sigma-70 factor, ECF subfamily
MDATAGVQVPADQAVTDFYRRHVTEVYRYFVRATGGDARLSEDLTQETFMACVRSSRAGTDDALTMPWLMGVARHKLIDQYRRQRRERDKLGRFDALPRPLDTAAPSPGDHVLDALSHLSPVHRLVLVLRYVDDLSTAEVAVAIGKSLRATESLVVRARQALHDHLPGDPS